MEKRYSLFTLFVFVLRLPTITQAQSATTLLAELETIHNTINSSTCANQQLISNRAMNLFLADKIGNYLSDYKSLSFYKNYITFNTGDGVFSLNHNFFQPTGSDKPITSFFVAGVKANAVNAIASMFTEKPYANELGATLQKAWIAKPKTTLINCFDKNRLDATRELIIVGLAHEAKNREADFLSSLDSLEQAALSDSTFARIKADLRQRFYENLQGELSEKFASLQYQALLATPRYRRITTHWTTVHAYLPIIFQRFTVAESFSHVSETKKAYPFALSIDHTRFWESKRMGRIFVNLELGIFLNNSTKSYPEKTVDYPQYKRAGGVDSLALKQRAVNAIFIGDYRSFLTPSAKLNLIYYPSDSHIGISSAIEQTAGTYNTLNWSIGIPIILIDKMGAPSANFELHINYSDITHSLYPTRKFNDNLSISLTFGIPFSKIIF